MPDMGQVLRLTHNNRDHNFEVLNTEPLSAETTEIPVLLDGQTFVLVRDGGKWLPREGTPGDHIDMVSAIGKTIALRYRI
jgi:hypothetical protein